MPVATTRTISLQGTLGHLIDIQVDVSGGVVKTVLVGRPDAALSESRDRCRMAITNTKLFDKVEWPNSRRVTILLSPADLPKRGTHFDLGIAIAVLAATGAIKALPPATVYIGELTLEGGLRSVPGVLPMVMAAARRGIHRFYVPEPQVPEASLVPGVEIFGVRSLGQVIAMLVGLEVPSAPPVAAMSGSRLLSWRGEDRQVGLDLVDVRGLPDERYAVEVAAAGGHPLHLTGPRGSGKTTLAERIPSILPDLNAEESLELTAIASLAGALDPAAKLLTRPPFLAPHHTATHSALLGGGSGRVRPGEISRAHCGVLFLDEFPFFRADVIEGLRQPLESGEVTISRGEETATYPARGLVVLASNPCPCGDYYPFAVGDGCRCSPQERHSYRRKLSGPITDRIDITRNLAPLTMAAPDAYEQPESSAQVRARVERARARQTARFAECGWRLNAHAPGPELLRRWPLSPEGQQRLDEAVFTGLLSRRGATRVHRLAWTVSDLSESLDPAGVDPARVDPAGVDPAWGRPGLEQVETALRLRTGEPLMGYVVGRAG
ncbi:MAG: YifB family Mg chelatase-like AAA ATPase [Nocardioides sp.]